MYKLEWNRRKNVPMGLDKKYIYMRDGRGNRHTEWKRKCTLGAGEETHMKG